MGGGGVDKGLAVFQVRGGGADKGLAVFQVRGGGGKRWSGRFG